MKQRILAFFCILILVVPMTAMAADQKMAVAHCKEYVTLRKAASSKSAAVIRIPLGGQVTVLDNAKNGYVKVRYCDRTGYLSRKYLEPYQEPSYTPRTPSSGYPVYYGNYGTAKYIEGRTVVVAIFADDATTSWNFNKKADQRMRLRNRFNLSVACAWLTEQTRRYRPNPGGFVWDWTEHGDLYFTHAFQEDIVHGFSNPSVKTAFNSYIHENIPT